MAKGKYATKAANRLAQTDNELIVELRRKLEEKEQEVVALVGQLAAAKADVNGRIIRGTKQAIAADIAEARRSIERAQDEKAEALESAATRIATVIGDMFRTLYSFYGKDGVRYPDTFLEPDDPLSLPALFAELSPSRVGELMEIAICGDLLFPLGERYRSPRARRRRTAAELRRDLLRAKADGR